MVESFDREVAEFSTVYPTALQTLVVLQSFWRNPAWERGWPEVVSGVGSNPKAGRPPFGPGRALRSNHIASSGREESIQPGTWAGVQNRGTRQHRVPSQRSPMWLGSHRYVWMWKNYQARLFDRFRVGKDPVDAMACVTRRLRFSCRFGLALSDWQLDSSGSRITTPKLPLSWNRSLRIQNEKRSRYVSSTSNAKSFQRCHQRIPRAGRLALCPAMHLIWLQSALPAWRLHGDSTPDAVVVCQAVKGFSAFTHTYLYGVPGEKPC